MLTRQSSKWLPARHCKYTKVWIAGLLYAHEVIPEYEFDYLLELCSQIKRLIITDVSLYSANTMDIEIIELVLPTKSVKPGMQMPWLNYTKISSKSIARKK